MPNIFKRGGRRYPIKRDQFGRTIRQRCFEAFDKGRRPAEIHKSEKVKFRTVCTYFDQWKKLPSDFQSRYKWMKQWLKSDPGLRQEIVEILSKATGQSEREIEAQLESPWGLKQLMTGEYSKTLRKERKRGRLKQRQRIGQMIVSLLEDCGVPLNDIIEKLEEVLKERSN